MAKAGKGTFYDSLRNIQMRMNIQSGGKAITHGISGFTKNAQGGNDYLHFNMPKGDIHNGLIEVEVSQSGVKARVALGPKLIRDLCKMAIDFADRVEKGEV